MVTHEGEKEDIGPFESDGLVARAIRGELKPETGQSPTEVPALAETAWINEDGTLRIHFVTYDGPNSPNRMTGDYELIPTDGKYQAVLKRHPGLEPGKPNTYEEYYDGRWSVSRNTNIIAQGRKNESEPPAEKQTA